MSNLTKLLPALLMAWFFTPARAQVTCDPVFPKTDDNVTIYYDATQGNGALGGVNPVYAHLGVITSASTGPSDWKHVATTWAVNNAAAMMTLESPNVWKKSFNIRSFFGIPANETVLKLAFVFRNSDGSIVGRASDGSDIFYDVFPDNGPLQAILLQPTAPSSLKNIGDHIPVKVATSQSATVTVYDNGIPGATQNNTQLFQTDLQVSQAGFHEVQVVAQASTQFDTLSFYYVVPGMAPAQDPPPGTEPGINYLPGGVVRLALYAPGKQVVHIIGDFNNWIPKASDQLFRSLDGNTWWIDLAPVFPGQTIRFQYLVDGMLRIADPLSTLILDPWNDSYIPPLTYPNLPAYPNGKTTGIVSVIQTPTAFNWQASNYQRPPKNNLVIYELLMRDFIARHDFSTLLDTLDYLQHLGVTAIELMPVQEFDGNISWGYNPDFHKALDKYYGSADALKAVVDACHQRNMAVIFDVTFNHITGQSPLAQLYWDPVNNRPAANNPWLNQTATHDFSVFNDFNHESQATKIYVKNCLKYWITEFKADGFRFDLSKGFTQKITIGNPAALAAYDPSRIAILKDYASFIWSIDASDYVILEHFADNSEEKELAEYGMMLWGNMWGAYKDLSLGYSSAIDISGINYKQRNWTVPHLVGYMESHDEERIAWELKTYGNGIPAYNLKTLPVGMRRIEMLNNLMYTIPGPKMLWEFGELGYDYSINTCEDGSVNNDCRLSPKPIRWDYFNDPYRRHLHDVNAALFQLRKSQPVFQTTDFQANISSGQLRTIFLNSNDLNVAVFANVGTTSAQVTNPAFQHTGFWYEYYKQDTLFVGSGVPTEFTLAPGEYRLYLDKVVALPGDVQLPVSPEPKGLVDFFAAQPNPVTDALHVMISLKENSDISLEIRDLSGRLVEQIVQETMPAGEQQFSVDASNWTPGIYAVIIRDRSGAVSVLKVLKI